MFKLIDYKYSLILNLMPAMGSKRAGTGAL